MSARALIIVKITSKNAAQTRLVEHDEMIQALAPNRPDQTLNVRRLPWTSRSDKDFFLPHFSDALAEGFAVDSVTIPEEEVGRTAPGESFDELLCSPLGLGIGGHIEMHYPTPLMGQHHEDKQKLESCSGNGDEIHENHLSEMIGEKGAPGLGGRFRSTNHVLGNRGFTDVDGQLEQFAVNFWELPKEDWLDPSAE